MNEAARTERFGGVILTNAMSGGRPLKATVCLLAGLAYTLAFTTLVIGHLNILTITFVPILIGLAPAAS